MYTHIQKREINMRTERGREREREREREGEREREREIDVCVYHAGFCIFAKRRETQLVYVYHTYLYSQLEHVYQFI